MARKKTWIERLFSFNQHRRRFGAGKISDNLHLQDYEKLKAEIIEGDEPVYTYGSKKEIDRHIKDLRAEFAGQSELLYYHAQLIVMIRREYKQEEHFRLFTELWESEHEFLIKKLNTRWLISATDTFADNAKEPLVRALALNSSVLLNTIKMQETERYLQHADMLTDDKERFAELTSKRVALFDGTSAFAVGTDDTLRNMRWRMDSVAKEHYVGAILMEVFRRLQEYDTVFRRFRLRHTRERTGWW